MRWGRVVAIGVVAYLALAVAETVSNTFTGHVVVLSRDGKLTWEPYADPPTAAQVDAAAAMPVASTPPASGGDCQTAAVLATIRDVESGGRYGIGSNAGGASGAYQFIQGTWDSVAARAGRRGLVGTPPYKASPADQDAVARQLVDEALGGTSDISRVPVVWYVGHLPQGSEWDTVPAPWAGNRYTPRQYQQKWMGLYQQRLSACGKAA